MTGERDSDVPVGDTNLEHVETPLSRLTRRSRPWLAALVALALLIPAGTWLVDEIRFRLSGTEVIETLEGELGDVDLADAVMLVRAAGCEPGTDATGSAFVVSRARRWSPTGTWSRTAGRSACARSVEPRR